jgi:hypothetical protein
MAKGKRPVPFRTRKLSLSAPMVLPGVLGGRVGRRRTSFTSAGSSLTAPLMCLCRQSIKQPHDEGNSAWQTTVIGNEIGRSSPKRVQRGTVEGRARLARPPRAVAEAATTRPSVPGDPVRVVPRDTAAARGRPVAQVRAPISGVAHVRTLTGAMPDSAPAGPSVVVRGKTVRATGSRGGPEVRRRGVFHRVRLARSVRPGRSVRPALTVPRDRSDVGTPSE